MLLRSVILNKINLKMCRKCMEAPASRALAWPRSPPAFPVIKYRGTPLDILLVQQDGWSGWGKAAGVRPLSHQHLPFFCPVFPRLLLYKKEVLEKRDGFSAGGRSLSALRGKYFCALYLMLLLPPVCLASLFLLPPPPLLFYLRSPSDGLTVSSSVSAVL